MFIRAGITAALSALLATAAFAAGPGAPSGIEPLAGTSLEATEIATVAASADAAGSSRPRQDKSKAATRKQLKWEPPLPNKVDGYLIRDLWFDPSPHLGLAFPGKKTAYFDVLRRAGVGIARINAPWSLREPARGQFDWGSLDKLILYLNSLDIEVLLTIDNDADWAVEPSDLPARNSPPIDMADWTNYLTALVERYDNDGVDDAPRLKRPVRYYQIVNEWHSTNNRNGGWSGTTEQLIDLVNASYDAVHSAYPEGNLVMGGISSMTLDIMVLNAGYGDFIAKCGWSPDCDFELDPVTAQSQEVTDYIQPAFEVLRQIRCDIASLHLYGPMDHQEARIRMMKDLLPGKPLISTECGGPSQAYHVGEITNPDHFLRAMQINLNSLSEGMDFVLWFRLGEVLDPEFGTWSNLYVPIFNADAVPKGGYWAYQFLAAILKDLDHVQRIDEGIYEVYPQEGPAVTVAWATAERPTFTLPAGLEGLPFLQVTDADYGIYQLVDPGTTTEIPLSDLPMVFGEILPGGAMDQDRSPILVPLDAPSLKE